MICTLFGIVRRQKKQRERDRQETLSSSERTLFHGIKWCHLESVARCNVDWRATGFSHGVMFGQGKAHLHCCLSVYWLWDVQLCVTLHWLLFSLDCDSILTLGVVAGGRWSGGMVKHVYHSNNKVKFTDIAVCCLTCQTVTGTLMPHSFTQTCLLTGGIPTFTPSEAGTQLCDPRGTQGWVDLVGLLHTEMIYPHEEGHTSKY